MGTEFWGCEQMDGGMELWFKVSSRIDCRLNAYGGNTFPRSQGPLPVLPLPPSDCFRNPNASRHRQQARGTVRFSLVEPSRVEKLIFLPELVVVIAATQQHRID